MGFHTLWKFFVEPLNEYFIFSHFRKCSKSLIHWVKDGGYTSFHFSKIRRLASRVAKATQSASDLDSLWGSVAVPKMAKNGQGSLVLFRDSVIVLKIRDQNSLSLSQGQNIWAWVVGDKLQRLHEGLTSGKCLDNFCFVQWARFRILHCITACLAQTEDVWTRFRTDTHTVPQFLCNIFTQIQFPVRLAMGEMWLMCQCDLVVGYGNYTSEWWRPLQKRITWAAWR